MILTLLSKWIFLIIAWLVLAGWHWREYNKLQQRHIEERIYDYPESPFSLLFQKAVDRSLQLVLVSALWVGTVIYYDVRQPQVVPQEAKPAAIASAPAYNELSPASGGTAPRTLPPKIEEFAPITVRSTPPKSKQQIAKPVLDTPSQLDNLKQRYEEIFITYFYLTRCDLANKEDYHLINSALIEELSHLNTPASLQQNILTAARGSYDEMYKFSPCSSAYLEPVLPRYQGYIAEIRSKMANIGMYP